MVREYFKIFSLIESFTPKIDSILALSHGGGYNRDKELITGQLNSCPWLLMNKSFYAGSSIGYYYSTSGNYNGEEILYLCRDGFFTLLNENRQKRAITSIHN